MTVSANVTATATATATAPASATAALRADLAADPVIAVVRAPGYPTPPRSARRSPRAASTGSNSPSPHRR
ncbi:hypothetical protein [Kitasatospora paranensis]|uniref:hypothetical protein n=1 Tax=Kitasatospora paranensis TaxID=258053 RepID=UPI0031F0F748